MTFEDFVKAVTAKMERGRAQYGDGSWYRPKHELVGELQEEAVDLVGWGAILYARCVGVNAEDPMSGLYGYLWAVYHASDAPPVNMTPHSYAIWVGATGVKVLLQSERLRRGDCE